MKSGKVQGKKKTSKSKSKSKPKRMKTFNSSQFSLLDEKNYLSVCDLFKNDLLKRRNVSNMPAHPKNAKSQRSLAAKKKKGGKPKVPRRSEPYEVVQFKSSLNSEIVFSHEDTKREDRENSKSEASIAIQFNEQYPVDNNRLLRISIRKEYHRKVEAALKIQKVFRGYLTRKILQKYVQNEQKLLSARIASCRSEGISEHSSYFAEKSFGDRSMGDKQLEKWGQTDRQPKEEAENGESSESDLGNEQVDRIAYRHQQPIYSHKDISQYLASSDEEEEFDNDAFDRNIIFETNEEYIESRKSSMHNKHEPKNKLSKTLLQFQKAAASAADASAHIPNNLRESSEDKQIVKSAGHIITQTDEASDPGAVVELLKTEKKQDDREGYCDSAASGSAKEETIKMTEESDCSAIQPANEFLETLCYERLLQGEGGPFQKKKTPAQVREVEKLKEDELRKWDQIISLVGTQIQKTIQSNAQINNFMQTIMEISIKNKSLLQLQKDSEEDQGREEQCKQQEQSKKEQCTEQEKCREEANRWKAERREEELREAKEIKRANKALQKLELFEDTNSEKDADFVGQSSPLEKAQDSLSPGNSSEQIGKLFKPARKKQTRISQKTLFFNETATLNPVGHCVKGISPRSSLENTGQMKQFLLQNLHDEGIEEMLTLREQLLRKRESEAIRKAHEDLSGKKISEAEFQHKLSEISRIFKAQKESIDKARDDISRGYRAAMTLTKDAYSDARKLGYKLPISRSADRIHHRLPLMYPQLIVDEMIQPKCQQPKAQEEQNSDDEFTEQQLSRFRRPQPYDIELAGQIADLNRNMMISEQFVRQQQHAQEPPRDKEAVREIYQIEESQQSAVRDDPRVQLITQKQLEGLLWEFAGELLVRPIFSQRLIDKGHLYSPEVVQDNERSEFLTFLYNLLPPIEEVTVRLNQKIFPFPSELLKCMRIDFSESEQSDASYQQFGKYESIFSQNVCDRAVQMFRSHIDANDTKHCSGSFSSKDFDRIQQEFSLGERLAKYVGQREKFLANRRRHTKELRWQVLNIEIHCIFDALNEQLIQLRSRRAGYSGIGLNQLTLSIYDYNAPIPISAAPAILEQGRNRVMQVLGMVSSAEEEDEEVLENDSKWIFYADEALSYGLELVYLVEEEIFSEFTRELRRKFAEAQ